MASKEFYERGLGMTLLKQVEIPKSRLTLYYYGYTDYTAYDHLRGDMIEIDNFLIPRLVLQYSWDSESNLTLSYHNGNSEPKGFGHIALTVEGIRCEYSFALLELIFL